MSASKGLRLTKEEVMLLVNLVEDNSVVTSRLTTASSNRLKEDAWSKITEHFNKLVKSTPRAQSQLKLKWENLKKSARKRSAAIRMNNLKTGDGKTSYVPSDDALDRVAAILELDASSGGLNDSDAAPPPQPEKLFHSSNNNSFGVLDRVASILGLDASSGGCDDSVGGDSEHINSYIAPPPQPEKIFLPSNNSLDQQNCQKQLVMERHSRDARAERDFAIAKYYELKKQKQALEESTRDEKTNYLPPDDTLDRVACVLELDASSGGCDDSVGGDSEHINSHSAPPPQPEKIFLASNNSLGKQNRQKQLARERQSRADRNFAIAEYFKMKKQALEENVIANRNKIKLETDLLQIQKIKLELEVLELENRLNTTNRVTTKIE